MSNVDGSGDELEGRIAVIGMAGRFPGGGDLETIWSNLRDGVEAVRFYTEEELLAAGESVDLVDDVNYVRAAAPLQDIDQFDAGFFGMSPRDAAVFDPQHRLFLECAWEAFEHAGYVGSSVEGAVGVFASCGLSEYMFKNVLANAEMTSSVGEWLIRHTGNDTNFLATRVSYEMDLRGPSMNVQTACSSTLVAVHQACQSLLNGECDLALAGGAVVTPVQDRGYLYKEGEILSPDGHCRAFDEKSAGTILSSAAGCVLLKPLAAAVADGDNVLAVIRGSAINNDGRAKVGYLAPSVDGQASVVTEALAVAGVDARDVSYVEAHGTGTLIGDPIEVAGLTQAYRLDTQDAQFCALGSLKTNIGHTGEASGVAAMIKTVLALQHGELPPSLHYQSPNPQADLPTSPFFVVDELRPWTVEPGKRRIAGITNLGAGGTNAHLIIEEAPPPAAGDDPRTMQLVTVSARSDASADRAAAELAAFLREHPDVALADVAFTRLAGRKQFRVRRAVVAATAAEAAAALESADARLLVRQHHRGAAPSVVFLVPGGGAQYPGMGRELYAQQPVFRRVIDECAATLRRRSGLDLVGALYPDHDDEAATRFLERPSIALPALFATAMATAALLESWGITPAAMIGHSAGEYVAACLAGVFSRDDGMALVALRGQLFETLDSGAMLSVARPEADVRARLLPGLDVAAVNTVDLTVVSGPVGLIADMEAALAAEDVDCSRVHIDVAAHSSMLDPILEEFGRFCRTIAFAPPRTPYVSNLTGDWITAAQTTDPAYWVDHLRSTVRFRDGIERILEDPNRVLVEIGPGRTLASFARLAPTKPVDVTATLRHPRDETSDVGFAMRALARLWASGIDLDADALHGGERRHRIPLPTYPFERQRYWVDPDPVDHVGPVGARAMRKRADIADWFYAPGWRRAVVPPVAQHETPLRWMVISDGSPLADEVEHGLAAAGGRVVSVRYGSRMRRVAKGRYLIDPARREQFTQLFEAVRTRDGLPDRIVHISAVGRPARSLAGVRHPHLAAYETTLRRDHSALVFLAFAASSFAQPMRLAVVTSGVHSVNGRELLRPERALLHGACRVIPRELAHVRSTAIDIDAPPSRLARTELAALAAVVVREVSGDNDDDVVAYRSGQRWLRSFDPVRLPAEAAPAWVDGSTILITGGLGGIGLAVAEGIARQAPHVHLVLVGRTALPEEHAVAGLQAAGEIDSTMRHRLETVRRIRALGPTVTTIAADITDAEALAGPLEELVRGHGAIDTVVHSAGVLDDALIALRGPDAGSPVIDVKAKGLLVLEELLAKSPPQRWVLFSSVSSLIGLPGQVDYTAANAFLDAFAAKIDAGGRSRAVVVNWNAWQQVGMAVDALRDTAPPPPRTRSALDDAPSPVELFDKVVDDGDNVLCTTEVRRGRQWMVDEHVVHNADAVLPGTGYVQLIRSAFTHGRQRNVAVELRDLVFASPFVLGSGDVRHLSVKVDRRTGSATVFAHNEQEPNATGRVALVAGDTGRRVDLDAVRARCAVRVDRFDGYSDQPFVDFGPRWGVLRRVEYGDGEAVVTTVVPDEFVGELDALWLHPAVLDMATGSAQALIPGFSRDETFFVPMFYGRLVSRSPIPAVAVSHVRLRPGAVADVAVFDVSICDEQGNEAVALEAFTMRRVASGFATATSPSAPDREVAFGLDSPMEAALREGIVPSEGVDALDRVLRANLGPQVITSSVDLHQWIAKVDADARVPDHGDVDLASASYGRPQISSAFEEPATPIERELANIWRELLGVDRVGRDDDFFELGGQSLIAVRLFARIRKQYSVDMPLATLFEAPTIAQCARVVAAQLGIIEAVGDDSSPAGGAVDSAAASQVGEAMSIAGGTAIMPVPTAASSLIPIASADKGRPLFIVHGAGGNILFLWSLARSLAGDRPIYGFQAMGVNASDAPDESVEQMATRYVDELVAEHDGPYLLGGYSGGGIVTLEMVRQLQAKGHEVTHVLLFDSVPPACPIPGPAQRMLNLVDNARRGGLRAVRPRYSLTKVTRYLARVMPQFVREDEHDATTDFALGYEEMDGYVDLYDHFSETAAKYVATTFDVDVTVFKASQIAPIQPWDYYWGRHVTGSLTLRFVQGDHHTMFYPEFIPHLAEQVRERIAEVELEHQWSPAS